MIEVNSSSTANDIQLRLTGTIDVRCASQLHHELVEALAKDRMAVSVDCFAVEGLDASCIQLLLAAKRASNREITIRVDSQSEAYKWFETAGVEAELFASN